MEKAQAFRYRNNSTVYINLDEIKPRQGNIKKEGLIIYDAFVDLEDRLLLLVNYQDSNDHSLFWVSESQIKSSNVAAYIKQLENFETRDFDQACNSTKIYTLPCKKKARTVGMFLGCFNCGIIVSFKEIFSSETYPQAASFFMGMISNFDLKDWPEKIKIILKTFNY